ncbi:hypothetical protein QJS10_CPA03g02455 [Acorus calamus]|uniref:Uncharacterized protein n=1 Tax=Acorus calamus TaxID=4465 RepID=A0AAV9F5X9_ACOCL|nr:hypothetical protein QJS10_CPA03g02455 [Acorus calamus]
MASFPLWRDGLEFSWSGLLSVDVAGDPDSLTENFCYGVPDGCLIRWTIDTKYYSADLSIWMAHLGDELSAGLRPNYSQLTALVMVFDMSENFEILLCVGNKVDLLPGHFAHTEYRRRLQKRGESTSDPHPEFLDYGIYESEGTSLLGDEEDVSWEIRKSCVEWCSQHNIEYVEACASNTVFDKCLSVDGDSQGVDRIYGALSAYMWPGMILKSGDMLIQSSTVDKEAPETSDDEADYEIEYEILSGGSDEPIDDMGNVSSSWDDLHWVSGTEEISTDRNLSSGNQDTKEMGSAVNSQPSSSKGAPDASTYFEQKCADGDVASTSETISADPLHSPNDHSEAVIIDIIKETPINGSGVLTENQLSNQENAEADIVQTSTSEVVVAVESKSLGEAASESDEDAHMGYEDLERLMSEISNMRSNMRLMPDSQRREMAAKLAMKMANMFADSSDEEFD